MSKGVLTKIFAFALPLLEDFELRKIDLKGVPGRLGLKWVPSVFSSTAAKVTCC